MKLWKTTGFALAALLFAGMTNYARAQQAPAPAPEPSVSYLTATGKVAMPVSVLEQQLAAMTVAQTQLYMAGVQGAIIATAGEMIDECTRYNYLMTNWSSISMVSDAQKDQSVLDPMDYSDLNALAAENAALAKANAVTDGKRSALAGVGSALWILIQPDMPRCGV